MIRLNDILGYNNLKIFQSTEFFYFSLDSIILANYTNIRLSDCKIVDFCSGNGVVPLILSRRCDKSVEAIEIQEKLYSLALDSINYNKLGDRIKIYNEDVKIFSNNKNNQNKYDLVLCNPPYFVNNINSIKNLNYEKSVARHEILINLEEICSCAKKVLKDNGVFSLIHRTDRLIEILDDLQKNNLEPKIIKFVYDKASSNSSLVLIQSQKNGKTGLRIEPPLILYNEDGLMTDEYKKLQTEVKL